MFYAINGDIIDCGDSKAFFVQPNKDKTHIYIRIIVLFVTQMMNNLYIVFAQHLQESGTYQYLVCRYQYYIRLISIFICDAII